MAKVTSSVSGDVTISDPSVIEVSNEAVIVEEAVEPTTIEWFANGDMEKWNGNELRMFNKENNPNVVQTAGIWGYGVEIEGTQPH